MIRKGAYVGMRASVIAREELTEIGKVAVIGACTIINKSIPSGKTVVGCPCRILN